MLALRTTDNWAFTLEVTVPVVSGIAETYTNTEVTASASAAALETWLNAFGRAWYSITFFGVSWSRFAADAGGRLTIRSGDTFELNGGAITCLGMDADTYLSTANGIQSAAGTWYPTVPIAVTGYARQLDEGNAEAAGAIRKGVPGLGAIRPQVNGIGTALDAARLAGILADAYTPRIADIDQAHTGDRLRVALGPMSRTRADMTYRMGFDVAGHPV